MEQSVTTGWGEAEKHSLTPCGRCGRLGVLSSSGLEHHRGILCLEYIHGRLLCRTCRRKLVSNLLSGYSARQDESSQDQMTNVPDPRMRHSAHHVAPSSSTTSTTEMLSPPSLWERGTSERRPIGTSSGGPLDAVTEMEPLKMSLIWTLLHSFMISTSNVRPLDG